MDFFEFSAAEFSERRRELYQKYVAIYCNAGLSISEQLKKLGRNDAMSIGAPAATDHQQDTSTEFDRYPDIFKKLLKL
jgi:hypothetical protein